MAVRVAKSKFMADIEKEEKVLEERVGKKRAGSIVTELELMRKGSNIAA